MTIQGLSDKVQLLDLRSSVPEIINDTEAELKMAQKEQLGEGYRADGRLITPKYSAMTELLKAKKGQRYDVVTLHDTGDFWASIEARADKSKIHWEARDWKFEQLVDKYSDKILGLDRDYLGVYTDEVFRPELKQYVESTTGLKMS